MEAAPVGGHVTGSTPESRFADSQISAAIYVILGDRSSYLYRVVKNLKQIIERKTKFHFVAQPSLELTM